METSVAASRVATVSVGQSSSPASADPSLPLQAGQYRVKPGDTLGRIGLETGQSWRDIARWNKLDNPNLIEVGQVLQVAPPTSESVAQTRPVIVSSKVEPRTVATVTSPATPTSTTAAVIEGIQWNWPAPGSVIATFDEAKGLKGLSLAGNAGDPVSAAADGRVVYAGSGLRGYGKLVIIKHDANFLSAYAHNQNLLVQEDQAVTRGQKIAEMGSTDAERVKLHFEIRRQGKPVDPAQFLPVR